MKRLKRRITKKNQHLVVVKSGVCVIDLFWLAADITLVLLGHIEERLEGSEIDFVASKYLSKILLIFASGYCVKPPTISRGKFPALHSH